MFLFVHLEWRTFFKADPDTGWKYAKLTNDYNPHHLNTFTARLVGYPGPMAHGMWTLSRTLAAIENS